MSRGSGYSDEEIIDLTVPMARVDHRAIANVIINLDTDESFVDLNSSAEKGIKKRTPKSKKLSRKHSTHKKVEPFSEISGGEKQIKFGDCPICWDELGINRLASTKCGHVFCLKCLEKSLKVERRCPTCRKVLKSNSGYHPLYLGN